MPHNRQSNDKFTIISYLFLFLLEMYNIHIHSNNGVQHERRTTQTDQSTINKRSQ